MVPASPRSNASLERGTVPSLEGASRWLNSLPLTPTGLSGNVVVVNFCTYTCINWLRTLPYVRAWAERYRDDGLVMIGVHTPEFPFEHDIENVVEMLAAMRVEWPIALDNDYAIWAAFANHYWPALYFIDADGRIRHHRFGEGDYDASEHAIQELLREAGADVGDDPALPRADGRRWRRTGRTWSRRRPTLDTTGHKGSRRRVGWRPRNDACTRVPSISV